MGTQVLGDKIISFRYVKNSPTIVVVEGMGYFQTTDLNKESFPFEVYDFLHFEPRSNIFQVSNGNDVVQMTDDQILRMKEYINTLPEMMDLPFACYDPNKSNVYVGVKSISEAKEFGFVSVLQTCDFPAAKYDVDNQMWVKIKAVIMDDGSLILDPSAVCDRCQILLSEMEWEGFPKPNPSIPNANWKYDADTQTWIDVRTIKEALAQYKMTVDGLFRTVEAFKYAEEGIDYYEVSQNPTKLSWLDLSESAQTDFFTFTTEEKDLYTSLKTKFESANFKVDSADALSTEFTTGMKDMILKLNLLKLQSEEIQKTKMIWLTLPENLWNETDIKIENLDVLVSELQTMVKTKYGFGK